MNATLTAKPMKRRILYNGIPLDDLAPEKDIEEVRKLYVGQFPDITSATIDGPTPVGDFMEYRITRSVGHKG